MNAPDLLEVGRIDKPHGLRGEVVVALITNRLERIAPGTVLHTDRGPLTIKSSRPHQHRWIVQFSELSDRNQAEAVHGLRLDAEPLEDADEIWVHDLIGCEVIDTTGISRGVVEAVEGNAASDLLVLDTGYLIPLRFMVGDPAAGTLHVDVPDGLFESQDGTA